MLDLDFWSDAIFGPYVLRCCETLWDVMWCFEMLCSVLRCCVVLWVWSSRVYTGHAHPLPMSQNVIGYLSPSLGLKFSDVPGGLAAISKVPALSLENRINLAKWWNITNMYIMYIYIYIYIIYRRIMTYHDMKHAETLTFMKCHDLSRHCSLLRKAVD